MLTDPLYPARDRLLKQIQRRLFSDYDSISRALHFPGVAAAYIPIPKSACTTIAGFLGQQFGVVEGGDYPRVHRREFTAAPLLGSRNPDVFYFTFVRNPWARLYSLYKSQVLTRPPIPFYRKGTARIFSDYQVPFRVGMDFSQFVDCICQIPDARADNHFRSQITFLKSPRYGLTADYIGRVENLQRDMNRVLRVLGLPTQSLAHLNRSTSAKEFQSAYTPALVRKVGRRYETDIEFLGYRFGDAPTH